MISRNKKKLYAEMSLEVSRICATCKNATILRSTDGYFCSRRGPVAENGCCKKYEYNQMLKRPSIKRSLLKDRFSENEFQID